MGPKQFAYRYLLLRDLVFVYSIFPDAFNMGDVRALLRAEKASRRIAHPYALYSSAGQLSCSICRIAVKSENAWEPHVRSQQHSTALARVEAQAEKSGGAHKKRKADADAQHDLGERKRSRNGTEDRPTADESEKDDDHEDDPEQETVHTQHSSTNNTALPAGSEVHHDGSPQKIGEDVDESEWAAFEREIAVNEKEEARLSALTAPASVQAQAISASEIQAQAQYQQQQSARDRRQAELDAEKEDASRQLEDEFDEMAAMEDRLKRMKEQREALRANQQSTSIVPSDAAKPTRAQVDEPAAVRGSIENADAVQDDDEDDEDDDEDLAIWGNRL